MPCNEPRHRYRSLQCVILSILSADNQRSRDLASPTVHLVYRRLAIPGVTGKQIVRTVLRHPDLQQRLQATVPLHS